MIEFVCSSHNELVLKTNLQASPIFRHCHLTVQRGYTNVSKAYNEAGTHKNMVCYIHHDVYLPETFGPDLLRSLKELPKDWEVAGVAGVTLNPGKQIHGYILDRGRVWGRPIEKPIKVDTLDELLLITRGDIKFDEQFETDFYGADICMGRNCYVISGFCHHNSSRPIGMRTKKFYEAQERFRVKWTDQLPVVTTCAMIEN